MALGLLNRFRLTLANDNNERRAELTEHLAELRTRLLRSALYLVIGAIVGWIVFPQVYHYLAEPILTALAHAARRSPGQVHILQPSTFVFHSFTGPFFLRLKLGVFGGLVIAVPLIVMELWGFVAPGLTPAERKPVRMIAPFSVLLFVIGASLAFWVMRAAVAWFMSYLGDFPNAILLQDPEDYIMFVAKMVLAFGLMFQLPIIMMGLGKVGIIRSAMLQKYWQYLVVGIFILAMIVTPSNDPFSMIVMAIPMVLLFVISIWLVKLVEPKQS
jgi:sec-independent protein translocase protein TatC